MKSQVTYSYFNRRLRVLLTFFMYSGNVNLKRKALINVTSVLHHTLCKIGMNLMLEFYSDILKTIFRFSKIFTLLVARLLFNM